MTKEKTQSVKAAGHNDGSVKLYGIIFVVILAVVLTAGMYFRYLTKELPSLRALQTFEPLLTTQIISADGVVISELSQEKRVLVPYDRIPDNLKYAAISTEDRRFYRHWGVDSYRFFGALVKNIFAFRYKEGFSTITMQLARDLYLNRKKRLTRKFREILTAIQIEKQYSKNEILEMYLNQSYFGHGAYGVQEAAHIYFNKEVDDLALEECALLIAQLKAPTHYSPVLNPDRALIRRNLVLRNMYESRFINAVQYNEARRKPISVEVKLRTAVPSSFGIAPYFTEYVRQKLETMQVEYGFDLYRDGLKVYTTIDTRAQAIAEKAVAEQLERQQTLVQTRLSSIPAREKLLEKISASKNIPLKQIPELARNDAFIDSLVSTDYIVQSAFAAMDLKTGDIMAMIGGRNFAESKFNRVLQAKRQPGSVFKPFIYTVAVDNGYPLTTELLNQPVTIIMEDGTRWTPDNYDKSVGGYTNLREGFNRSLNLISVRLIQQIIPPKEVALVARKMGISTYIAPVDAIALGSSSVYPIEIIAAYSAFPNGGLRVEPRYIRRIEDRFGNVVYPEQPPVKQEVLSEETAYLMTDLCRSVIQRGTGANAHRVYGFNRPAGGKTGTTNGWTDAWFVGFTKQIVAGAWVGVDDPAYPLGDHQSGAVAALPIWSKFMKAVHDTLALPVEDFEMPPGVVELEICNETKELASKYCPVKIKEIFIEKYKPVTVCRKHGRISRKFN